MAIELLGRTWKTKLLDRTADTRSLLIVCAPFISLEGCQALGAKFSHRFRKDGQIQLLSDLSPLHQLQESTDPDALRSLLASVRNSQLRHLPRLHAKVYIFDLDYAIVTSANLTGGGLSRNFEYGVGISDCVQVSRIRDEIGAFARLGADVGPEQLDIYCELAKEVREKFAEQLRSASREAKSAFNRSVRQAEDELVRLRSDGGPPTRLFAETILFLLQRHGPLSTRELHPLVQNLHPDLCDDSIDRVIDGVHFGKKWKHWVRSAQQRLKDDGLIELINAKWHAHSPPASS